MNAVNPELEKITSDKPSRLRTPLMIGGPLLLALLVAWFYAHSGRYITTDNAYVKANKVAVSAQVSGVINNIAVKENQQVEAGDLLLSIDAASFQIALDKAESQLAEVSAEIRALQASYRQKQASLEKAEGNLAFAQRELERQLKLAERNLVAEGNLDATKHRRDQAAQQVIELKQNLQRIVASLGGDANSAVDAHPRYRSALAAKQQAALDLQHARVVAPFAGIASKVPQLGQYVNAGVPVISVVDNRAFWVEANFKETELAGMARGQPVSIKVDSYPDALWQARVDSIGQASGAEFALLPAQNATGNWVKVVQRIPVRIVFSDNNTTLQLRAGMSATVTVDTAADS